MIEYQVINHLIFQTNIGFGYSKEPSELDDSFKHKIII